MSTYKLIYFNGRGRAELSRLIFAQAGVDYEDKRINFEEWQKFKPSTEFGALPKLEVDGKLLLSGSGPIARFLGERFGLAGKDDVENAYIAGISDFISDLVTEIFKARFEKDEARKAELKKALEETQFPKFLGALDKLAEKSSEGWLVGKLTWVDFDTYVALSYLPSELDLKSSFKNLAKLKDSVEALPNIKAWLEKRPQTDF